MRCAMLIKITESCTYYVCINKTNPIAFNLQPWQSQVVAAVAAREAAEFADDEDKVRGREMRSIHPFTPLISVLFMPRHSKQSV